MAAARRMKRRGAGQEGYYGLKMLGLNRCKAHAPYWGSAAAIGSAMYYLYISTSGLSMANDAAFWIHIAVLTATLTAGLFLMYTGVKPEAGPVPIGSCR